MVMQPVRVGQVFVPGGRPTVTYVPRDELQPERRLDDYLAERHKVLSVSGPTKTAKTGGRRLCRYGGYPGNQPYLVVVKT